MTHQRKIFIWMMAVFAFCLLGLSCSQNTAAENGNANSTQRASDNWPQFRGERATGIASDQDLPLTWDVKEGTNILWKTAIPGLGHSSPSVWDDRIFITTAVQNQGQSSLKVGMYGDVKSIDEKDAFSWHIY